MQLSRARSCALLPRQPLSFSVSLCTAPASLAPVSPLDQRVPSSPASLVFRTSMHCQTVLMRVLRSGALARPALLLLLQLCLWTRISPVRQGKRSPANGRSSPCVNLRCAEQFDAPFIAGTRLNGCRLLHWQAAAVRRARLRVAPPHPPPSLHPLLCLTGVGAV